MRTFAQIVAWSRRSPFVPLALALVAGAAVLWAGSERAAAQAQEAPAAAAPRAQLVLTLRGAQKSLTDRVGGVLLEYDHRMWDLVITGVKNRGQFTCEVRSADRAVLFDLQRAVLAAPDLTVNCADGTPTPRGGVLINLDDPSGGSFVLEARRQ